MHTHIYVYLYDIYYLKWGEYVVDVSSIKCFHFIANVFIFLETLNRI